MTDIQYFCETCDSWESERHFGRTFVENHSLDSREMLECANCSNIFEAESDTSTSMSCDLCDSCYCDSECWGEEHGSCAQCSDDTCTQSENHAFTCEQCALTYCSKECWDQACDHRLNQPMRWGEEHGPIGTTIEDTSVQDLLNLAAPPSPEDDVPIVWNR